MILRSLAPLALMGAIFYLSAQPAGADLTWWEVGVRKVGHFSGYAALTLLWTWALAPRLRRRALPVAVAIAVLYSISDEYHQSLVESRHGTPRDVLIDALGALTAALAVRLWFNRKRRSSDPALVGGHEDGLGAVERT